MNRRIVEFDRSCHLQGLTRCVIELQDYERELDSRLPAGADIASDYLTQMFRRCHRSNGKVYIVEVGDAVAGYVTVLARVSSGELADGDIEYALVADLFVAEQFRRQRLGQQLLEKAERFAAKNGSRWLRIAVLTSNKGALDLYEENGFRPLFVEMEKQLPTIGNSIG